LPTRKRRLYWDSGCFIALFNQQPTTPKPQLDALQATFQEMLDGRLRIITSDMYRVEVFGGDKDQAARVADQYVASDPVDYADPSGLFTTRRGIPGPTGTLLINLNCLEECFDRPLRVYSTSDPGRGGPHGRGEAADVTLPVDPFKPDPRGGRQGMTPSRGDVNRLLLYVVPRLAASRLCSMSITIPEQPQRALMSMCR
jgi:hypothetical protein